MKMIDKLREANIYNTHEILVKFGKPKINDIAISYRPPDRMRVSGTAVWSPSHKTDPAAPWYAYGNKFFSGRKTESLPAAKNWAIKKYGIDQWSACPTDRSTFIPNILREAVERFIEEKGE